MNRVPGARRRLHRVVALAAVAGAVLSAGCVAALTNAEPARALTAASMLQSFNASDIISDQVMYNSSTMSMSAIQSFLNAQQPTCAPNYTCMKSLRTDTPSLPSNLMCGAYQGGTGESAAAIIYKVAKACRINPQTILVMLEKEQSLVTGRQPYSGETVDLIYRKATGLGCPDTAACDPAKYGFFNQLYGLGYWLIRYTTPPGTTGAGWTSFSWFPVGKASSILYNPSASCGAKTVTIQNKATASLYYYTPYTPNAGALAAGWGTASCGAYGNRNFFLYFTSWFGSTHYTVTGAISTLWKSLGGSSGTLGYPTANAVTETANGGGSHQSFQGGTVYSSPAGTFVLQGAIRTEYNRRSGARGTLAWPSAAQQSIAGGFKQAFTGGDVYSSSRGTYAVRLDIRAAYGTLGGVTGVLGFPTATAAGLSGGTVQRFAGGAVYYTSATGAWGVVGGPDRHYMAAGGPSGALGWPVGRAAAVSGSGTSGTRQSFEHGEMYSSSAGTAGVTGTIRTFFAAHGAQSGSLGWPVADAATTSASGGGAVQVFAKGRIYVPASGAPQSVTGATLATYLKRGEVAGSLGWPTTAMITVSAHGTTGQVQRFQRGATYSVGSTTRTVTGSIFEDYLHNGGPLGGLGWVTGSATSSTASGGGWSQTFAAGTIFYSSRTKESHPLTGALLKVYLQRGGVTSTLGWPGAKHHVSANGGGDAVGFTSGYLYSSKAGIFAVRTGLLAKYLALSGPSGRLAWPTGNAHLSSGHWIQSFQHGRITWTPGGSTTVKYF